MKRTVFAVIAVLVSGSAVMAGGDKASTAFADPSGVVGGTNGFTNGTSSGQSKSGGCTVQIQFKGLGPVIADGDQVICIGSADVRATALPNPAGNSVVWRVPAKGGKLKIKNSVAGLDVGGNHCGSGQTISFNAKTTCFLPDGAYDPAALCAGAGMLWVAAPAGTVNLLGLCQGFTLGARVPNPATGEIAESGMTILIGAK